MKTIIALCLIVVCILSFLVHRLEKENQHLLDKLEAYEYTESEWLNYETMLKSGKAFYDNGRLIMAAHIK